MSYWSYALINGRLGEIHFDRKHGKIIYEGHSYLRKDERLTLREAAALCAMSPTPSSPIIAKSTEPNNPFPQVVKYRI